MTEMNILPTDVRRLVDEYLDSIEAALRQTGTPRSERRAVCDEVESQILEQLSARCADSPTASDARAVLAELDPPEAYAGDSGSERTPAAAPVEQRPSQMSWLAVTAASTAILGTCVVLLLSLWIGRFDALVAGAIEIGLIGFLSAIMGVEAIREMRRDPRGKRGYLLAFTGVVFLPLVLFNATAVAGTLASISHFAGQHEARYRVAVGLHQAKVARARALHQQQGGAEEDFVAPPFTFADKRPSALYKGLTVVGGLLLIALVLGLSTAVTVKGYRAFRPQMPGSG